MEKKKGTYSVVAVRPCHHLRRVFPTSQHIGSRCHGHRNRPWQGNANPSNRGSFSDGLQGTGQAEEGKGKESREKPRVRNHDRKGLVLDLAVEAKLEQGELN